MSVARFLYALKALNMPARGTAPGTRIPQENPSPEGAKHVGEFAANVQTIDIPRRLEARMKIYLLIIITAFSFGMVAGESEADQLRQELAAAKKQIKNQQEALDLFSNAPLKTFKYSLMGVKIINLMIYLDKDLMGKDDEREFEAFVRKALDIPEVKFVEGQKNAPVLMFQLRVDVDTQEAVFEISLRTIALNLDNPANVHRCIVTLWRHEYRIKTNDQYAEKFAKSLVESCALFKMFYDQGQLPEKP